MTELVTSRGGYARLQQRLQEALDSYNAVCATNAEAADAGDSSVWHDNFAYEENQREMHKFATRVSEIRALMAKIRIVEPPELPTEVQVGCIVTFRDEEDAKEWSFEVAGYEDGDASQGRVSYTAPLMRKLMGASVGEDFELFFAGKNREVVVVKISRS